MDYQNCFRYFGEYPTTAERRSHVILSLCRSFTPLCGGWNPIHRYRFALHDSQRENACAHCHRLSRWARPPFTLTVTLFGALRVSLFEATILPADFCNKPRRTDTKPELSLPRGDEGHDLLPVPTHHADVNTWGLARASTRWYGASCIPSVRSLRPRCWLLLLSQVFPTAIPKRPRHARILHHVIKWMNTSEWFKVWWRWRMQVSGPSEGRVLIQLSAWVRALGARWRRSPPRHPEDTRCRRCDRLHENEPHTKRDGPT